GAHQLALRIDELELLDRLLDRLGDDVPVLDGGHAAELPLGDQLHRLDAEPGPEPAIERARGAAALDAADTRRADLGRPPRAAALDVAEHRRADLAVRLRADEVGEPRPGAAEALLLRGVARRDHGEAAALGLRALRDHDDRVAHAAAVAAVERLDHALRVVL